MLKVADVKHRQGKFDIAIVSRAIKESFLACLTGYDTLTGSHSDILGPTSKGCYTVVFVEPIFIDSHCRTALDILRPQ